MKSRKIICPACNTQLGVMWIEQSNENLAKFARPNKGIGQREKIFMSSEQFVLQALAQGLHFNKQIGEYVATHNPEWIWKGKDPLIGFVLKKMVDEGQIIRSPEFRDKGGYVSRFDLPSDKLVLGKETKQE